MTVDSIDSELPAHAASVDIINTLVDNALNETLEVITEVVAIKNTTSDSTDILGIFRYILLIY